MSDPADQPSTLIRHVGLLIGRRGGDLAETGRTLRYYALNYIVKGTGRFRDDETAEQAVGPGSMFILRPGVMHRFRPDSAWDEYYVTFEGEPVRRCFGDIVPARRGHLRAPLDPTLAHRFEALYDRWSLRADRDEVRIRHLLHDILMRYHDAWRGPDPVVADDLVGLTKALLRTQLARPRLDLRRFAREHALSYERLRKRFTAATGVPPHRYWLTLKLGHAEFLLRSTTMSVGGVAAAVGFEDAGYFSRLFTQRAGVSPRAYRCAP